MNMEADAMQWLVRWAAMVQTRFKEGKDGKTPWERMRGKRCDIEVVPWGEVVWYSAVLWPVDTSITFGRPFVNSNDNQPNPLLFQVGIYSMRATRRGEAR